MIALEGLQRRFSRVLPGMEHLSYEVKLDRLELFSLEQRRLRGDMIEGYKIMRDTDRVDKEQLFPLVEGSVMNGHRINVRGRRFRGDVKENLFFNPEGGRGGLPHIL